MIMVLLKKINFEPYNLEALNISGGLPCPSRTAETQRMRERELRRGSVGGFRWYEISPQLSVNVRRVLTYIDTKEIKA